MLLRSLLALVVGTLFSCAALADSRVLATIKPVQLISAALLDGIDEPAVLLPPGVSPHAFALRPSDRRALASAERIYWVGPNKGNRNSSNKIRFCIGNTGRKF